MMPAIFKKGFNTKAMIFFAFVVFTGCSTSVNKGLTGPEQAAVKYFNAFLAADSEKLKQHSTKKHYQQKFAKTPTEQAFKPNLLTLLSLAKDDTYTKKLQYLDDNTATLDIELFKQAKMGWQLTLIKNDNDWQVDDVKPTVDSRYQALYVSIEKTGLSTDKSSLRPEDTAILVTNNTEHNVSCRLFTLLAGKKLDGQKLDGQNKQQIRLGFRASAKDTEQLIIPKGLDSSDYHLTCQSQGSYDQSVNFSVR
ncbi:MAG: hypothetical protein ACI8WB_004212 [Phenylobacterium sp.]|jgi:hypothetical protein